MIRIFNAPDALDSLGIKEWSLSGIPTNEEEFLEYFSKVASVDQNNHAVFSKDPKIFGVTWDQIHVEILRLQTDYNNKNYQRHRAAEYPSIVNQLDYIYHNGIDAWKADMIAPVKEKYPKT